ncbi:TIGR03364 family FAD-dependent oxidoreductase [Zavarzinia sp.]|uniref:TIGR03364 family FAD-dependent oxidoreductase n=1 Tax=Zavarzinia sp. TaxID=2027920 RepID=UPI003567ABD7
MSSRVYDLAVVGAGIVGLAHALAAARAGKRVVVIDRDAFAVGATIRNFGFVTVTGQQAGTVWNRARRSREIWADVAPRAGIRVLHRGTAVIAHRPEAAAVVEAFCASEMGESCEMLGPTQMADRLPLLRHEDAAACLWSPHEMRIESREAVPQLAAWLEGAMGVTFLRQALVKAIELPRIETTAGMIEAGQAVVCPGGDFLTLYPELWARHSLDLCKLHMLRLAPQGAGWVLPGSVMNDLSLGRYLGFAELPAAEALKKRLAAEEGPSLENGIHLIVVQSADGSLVVGDSHHYGPTHDPFQPEPVDALMVGHARRALHLADERVVERWIGVYPHHATEAALIEDAAPGVRAVMVTSGTGMSTAFALAEDALEGWLA